MAIALGGVSWAIDRISWFGIPEGGGEYVAVAIIKAIGNLPTLWLLGAFAVGAAQGRALTGGLAATIALMAAVAVYYVLIATAGDRLGVDLLPAALAWVAVAGIAGPILGAAGGAWRADAGRRAAIGAGVLGGTFVAMGIFILAGSVSVAAGVLHVLLGGALGPLLVSGLRARALALATAVSVGIAGGIATLLVFTVMRAVVRG